MQLFEKYPSYTEEPLRWRATQERAFAIQLRPALRFRFPLLKEKNNDIILFNVEPGMFINLVPNETLTFAYEYTYLPIIPPTRYEKIKNKGGDIFSFHFKGYVSADLDNFMLSAGYAWSNFDIYTGRRNIVVDGASMNERLWKRRATHSFFLTFTFFLNNSI
jgi:hypothetical protein